MKVYKYDNIYGLSEAEVEYNGKIYNILYPEQATGCFKNKKKIMKKSDVDEYVPNAVDIYIGTAAEEIEFLKNRIKQYEEYIEIAKDFKHKWITENPENYRENGK